MEHKEYYSTFVIAKMIGVYHRTVSRWADEGKLKAFSTPGGHRRVKAEDLAAFLKEYNMPVPQELIANTRKRILIVEDEEPVLRLIKKTISAHNSDFEIETANDGFKAGKAFSEFKPDLVIIDIKLPGIDGIEVCKLIREQNENVKIIAITGHDTETYRKKMLDAGADDFFPKPLNLKGLMSRVDELLTHDKKMNKRQQGK